MAVASAALRLLDDDEPDEATQKCLFAQVPFKILERIPRSIFLRVLGHYEAEGCWFPVIHGLERCPHFWPDSADAVRQLGRLD